MELLQLLLVRAFSNRINTKGHSVNNFGLTSKKLGLVLTRKNKVTSPFEKIFNFYLYVHLAANRWSNSGR